MPEVVRRESRLKERLGNAFLAGGIHCRSPDESPDVRISACIMITECYVTTLSGTGSPGNGRAVVRPAMLMRRATGPGFPAAATHARGG